MWVCALTNRRFPAWCRAEAPAPPVAAAPTTLSSRGRGFSGGASSTRNDRAGLRTAPSVGEYRGRRGGGVQGEERWGSRREEKWGSTGGGEVGEYRGRRGGGVQGEERWGRGQGV